MSVIVPYFQLLATGPCLGVPSRCTLLALILGWPLDAQVDGAGHGLETRPTGEDLQAVSRAPLGVMQPSLAQVRPSLS
jgi:hypothetical protein